MTDRRSAASTEANEAPLSIGVLRATFLHGREPPPVQAVARLPSYRWLVVGTVFG